LWERDRVRGKGKINININLIFRVMYQNRLRIPVRIRGNDGSEC
jgi:hypothetical protein